MRHIFRKTYLVMFVFATLASLATVSGDVYTVGPLGPPTYDYDNIQDAIDAASAGDTIIVYSGTYSETIVVDIPLTLTGDGNPTIDGGYFDNVVTLAANGCTISGFTVKSGSSGIYVQSNGNTISGNTISDCWEGVKLVSGTSGNEVSDNIIQGNWGSGVYLDESDSNNIHHNTIFSAAPEGAGIHLTLGSELNTIHHNDLDYGMGMNANDDNDPSTNTWYDDTVYEGNWWGDYTGTDGNGDGIGDTPYTIPGLGGAQDLYPLMPDTPPTIDTGSISVEFLSASKARISWDTNQANSDHKVVYSLNSDLSSPFPKVWDNNTLNPSITLGGLNPDTEYWYKCVSYNGNDPSLFDESSILSFTTPRGWTLYVDDDNVQNTTTPYNTIMSAVAVAEDFDTVAVHEGLYEEDVILDKPLILTGDTGGDYPKVEGITHAIEVRATRCSIEYLNVSAKGFSLAGGYDAIHIGYDFLSIGVDCGHTKIKACDIFDSGNGIYIHANSHNNTIIDCNIRRNGQGIYAYRSDLNNVTGTLVYNNGKGIVLTSCDQNTVFRCLLVNNSMGGYGMFVDVEFPDPPYFEISREILVENCTFVNNALWFQRAVVDSNVIKNIFKIESHPDTYLPANFHGIRLGLDCDNVTLSHNYVRGKIVLDMSDHSGILLDSVTSCTLTNNVVKWMYKGVSLMSARGVTMRDNTFYENIYNFHIDTYSVYSAPIDTSLFEHDIDTSNLVGDADENRTIYYYVDQNDLDLTQITVPDIGFLAVVNGQNIQAVGLILSENSHGILLVNVDGATIDSCFTWNNHLAGVSLIECQNVELTGCSLKNNGDDESYGTFYSSTGVSILRGSDNTVTDCDASNNERIGILLDNTQGNTVENCFVIDNGLDALTDGWRGMGMCLRTTTDNIITANNITEESDNRQYFGIWMDASTTGNTIYNNDFNNNENAYDLGGLDTWNIAKTLGTNIIGGPYLGGNHWSDYLGGDYDFDGLGDTLLPYTEGISTGGDNLPLTDNVLDDGVAPTIILVSPQEGATITKSWVEIKVSSPDPDVDQWWYSLDGGANVYFTPNTPSAIVSGLSEGDHTLDIYVNDFFDRTSHEQVNFKYVKPASSGGIFYVRTLEEVPEELAQFKIDIVTPKPTAITSRQTDLVIRSPYRLDRASYRLDDGENIPLTGLMTSLSRLTIGEHRIVVSGEAETGALGRGEVSFIVEPLGLGEVYSVGPPEFVDDAAFTFMGRDVDCELSFEARDISGEEVRVYVNKYLSGQPGVVTTIESLYEEGVTLGWVPQATRWQWYSFVLNSFMVFPDVDNMVSFIHAVNPGRLSGTQDWQIRNVTIRPLTLYDFPEITVTASPRALGVDGTTKPTIRIEGVSDPGLYDAYLYVVLPNGTALYYPEWTRTPQTLAEIYLQMNHYGALPGRFTYDEAYPPGTYRMVAKITVKDQSTPVSLSTDRFYCWDRPSVKLYSDRGLYTAGDDIVLTYAITAPEPFNGSLLVSLERPNESRVYLPARIGTPYSTPLEPAVNVYDHVLEDTIDATWPDGTYILRASLFDSNATLVDDDIITLDVRREPYTIYGYFYKYNVSETVIYSRIGLYDSQTLRYVTGLETDGEHQSYEIQAPPGSYYLSGEAVTDNGNFYGIRSDFIGYSYGNPVRYDIPLKHSTGKITLAQSGLTGVSYVKDPKPYSLLYQGSYGLLPEVPDHLLLEAQEGETCPKPKVFVNAGIKEDVLEDLLDEYPGDDLSTLKRYYSAKLTNLLKASNPGVDFSSYAEVLDGLTEMENKMLWGQEGEMSSVGKKLNAEYLITFELSKLGDKKLLFSSLLDVDLAMVVERHDFSGDYDPAINNLAMRYAELASKIQEWETRHPVPPRGPQITIALSKPSVTPVNGENQVTITATVRNCKGQPVEGVQVYFKDAGSAVSGSVPRGRVAAESDPPGSYCYSTTNAAGEAQAEYTLIRGVNPADESVDVFVVGRGSKKVHQPARFKINGVGLKAWAEKPSLAPMEDTIVRVKLFMVEEGLETPLAGKKVYFDKSGIKDSILVPLGLTDAGLLVTDNAGESTMRFIAGDKQGEIGIYFRYDVGVDDPQFPGFMTGNHVSDKAIIEIKAEEFLVKIFWVEEFKFPYIFGKEGYYEGNADISYGFSLSSSTIWDRRGGKEETQANLVYEYHKDYYRHETHVGVGCRALGARGCADYWVSVREDYTRALWDAHETGAFNGKTVNSIFKKDALGNLYLKIKPINIPFRLDGYLKVHVDHWWEDYEILDELDGKGQNIKIHLGGGSEPPKDWNLDYGGKRHQPIPYLMAEAVMYKFPEIGGLPDPWFDGTFASTLKIERVGQNTYKPFTYKFEESGRVFGWTYVGDMSVSRTFTVQVVKK